jgi:hypothetical protein
MFQLFGLKRKEKKNETRGDYMVAKPCGGHEIIEYNKDKKLSFSLQEQH